MGFDLVAQDEIGARVAGLGLVELVAEGGECLGPPGRGERVEPDEQSAGAGADVAGDREGLADESAGLVAGAGVVAVQGPGQEGFVGGSMGDDSVILEGVESAEAAESLFSTVHGAGRIMSRTQAAGKIGRRKRWACAHRDCDRVFEIDGVSANNPAGGRVRIGVCPDHPDSRVQKVWIEEQLKPGKVDWPAVQARLREQGIVLVGGGADEAPEVYKRLRRCSTRTPARSASSTRCAHSAWRWRVATWSTRTRTEGPPAGGPSAVPALRQALGAKAPPGEASSCN